LMSSCADGNAVSPQTNALEVLKRMRTAGNTRMMVVDTDRLVGIVTLKDLLNFIAVRLDLQHV